MAYSFQEANRAFKADKIADLASDPRGLRFLILRSLARSEYMRELAVSCGMDVTDTPTRDLLKKLFYSSKTSQPKIEDTINSIYIRERSDRKKDEDQLLNELYQLRICDWGGLHQNSLEKTIVDNYVKRIQGFNELCNSIENKLYPSMRSYVLCSWYNHWTSIIIEDIFKDHDRVLPAVGLIKKIDFFIDNIPFDLKVTYLPEGFVKQCRKMERLRPELSLLKKFCKKYNIYFSRDIPDAKLLEDLWCKVGDYPSSEAAKLLSDLKSFRDNLVDNIIKDSSVLIRWLYENQGVRRFDASNRLFLILIKKSNYFDSWKLKRAKDLLVNSIHNHLDQFSLTDADKIQFTWEGKRYSIISKAVVITQE